MPIELTDRQLLYLRLRSQRLTDRAGLPPLDPLEVTRAVGAHQAQDAYAAVQSVWARSAGLTVEAVEHARSVERTLVRTWCLRGTLHLVAADDLGWLLVLCGPVFIAATRRRRAELGLDDETFTRGSGLLREVLTGQGPLPREVLAARLSGRGLYLQGQAIAHLLGRAALEGLICLGPDRGAKATYVLLDEWLPPLPVIPRKEALAHLARRYLEAYGPAGPQDLAAWSGLPREDVRAAWETVAAELVEFKIAGRPIWLLPSQMAWLNQDPPDQPDVRLLPAFDTFLLGYQSRAFVIPASRYRQINAGGGIIHPVLLAAGQAGGVWRLDRRKNNFEVRVRPFERLAPELLLGLEAEAADLGRFLGRRIVLNIDEAGG